MSNFKVYDLDNAPEKSIPFLEQSKKANGRIPGLHGVLAGSPSTFEAYLNLHKLFTETSFNAEELTVVWQTINVENECHYCIPAHTGIAHMMKVDPALTEALRNKEAMPTEKLQALQNMTLAIVRDRGRVSDGQLAEFFAADYSEQQVLEIILGLAQKTISNYTNHFANTPVDTVFQKFAWEPRTEVEV